MDALVWACKLTNVEEPPVSVIYKGIEYKRNPDAKHRNLRVYYRTSKGSYLHRDVWLDNHPGEVIPKGMHIHHDDHDPFNNEPGNLVMITPREHKNEHRGEMADNTPFMWAARDKANEWHRSEEGRAWHRGQGKQSWDREPQHKLTCTECGTEFMGWFEKSGRSKVEGRYCSRKCLTKARDRRYLETVTCPVCGSEYQRDKYHPNRRKTCSISCATKQRWAPDGDWRKRLDSQK